MTVGFFTVFRSDPRHFLHAASLVRESPSPVVQLTDDRTPVVPGVSGVRRIHHGPMLERRLEHYGNVDGDWLLVDTDVSIRKDVSSVFDDPAFDVALTDRNWPHLPQASDVLQTMPFNTGVAFSRAPGFWRDVLKAWMAEGKTDWLSEQRAVYAVVRSGQWRVKILPGQIYNYPPQSQDDTTDAAIYHYKGPHRKLWLSQHATKVLGQPAWSERKSEAA